MLHNSFLLASFQWQRSVNPSRHPDNRDSCNVLGNNSGTFTLTDLKDTLVYGDGYRDFLTKT